MDLYDSTYYNFSKTLMCLVGLWPGQEFRTRWPRIIISYSCLCMTTSSLLAKFFTIEYNVDNIVDLLSFLIPSFCYLVGYITFHWNFEKIIILLEWIKTDWEMLEHSEELDIIKKYTSKSKNISIIMAVIFYIFIFITVCEFTLPVLLDTILPLNETRGRKLFVPLETFVKLEYTTAGLIFIVMILAIVGIVAIAVYSWFLIGIYHTCGMFTITGYILEHAFEVNDQYFSTKKEHEVIRKKIIRTISFHIRTIKLLEFLKDISEVCYSVQILLAMVIIAAQYVKIMLVSKETLLEDINKIISLSLEVTGVLFSVFINCHAGQEIINHSIDVFNKAIVAPWYLAPKNTQTSAVLILMRSQIPCIVGISKTFISSYEFFVSLLKTSMSYATVCYTMK